MNEMEAHRVAYATWEACAHESEVSGEVCLNCIAKTVLAERARAHAEGLEAGLRQAARLASSATADPESRLIHPDIPFKDFGEPARGVAHATAQAIAAEILALIPAAPEVNK